MACFAHSSENSEYQYLALVALNLIPGNWHLYLNGTSDNPSMRYYARSVIFGHDRIVPALSGHFKPIQPEEIEQEIRAYQAYADSFSREQVLKRPVTYAVIPADVNFDFTNLDRWYERDAGESFGDYNLYRVKLRK